MGIFRQQCRDIGRRDIRTKFGVDIVLDNPEHSVETNFEKYSLGEQAPKVDTLEPSEFRGGSWGVDFGSDG